MNLQDIERELFRLRQARNESDHLIRLIETQKEEIVSLRRQRGALIEEARDLNAVVNHLQAGRQIGKSGVTQHQVASIIEACAQRVRETRITVVNADDPMTPERKRSDPLIVYDEAGPYPEVDL